jgi:hypothetical protein
MLRSHKLPLLRHLMPLLSAHPPLFVINDYSSSTSNLLLFSVYSMQSLKDADASCCCCRRWTSLEGTASVRIVVAGKVHFPDVYTFL